jgi:hypothetical protein
MFGKILPAVCATLLAYTHPLVAQTTPASPSEVVKDGASEKAGETSGPNRFWQATLSGGHYMVALDRISSVSRHQFLLDGTLIVDEVTIDTVGQSLARFYFITPVTEGVPGNSVTQLTEKGSEMLKKGADRVGTSLQNMVVKTYPGTTHARSIEYRVLSAQDLTALYDSVRNSWESGRGRKFAVK